MLLGMFESKYDCFVMLSAAAFAERFKREIWRLVEEVSEDHTL